MPNEGSCLVHQDSHTHLCSDVTSFTVGDVVKVRFFDFCNHFHWIPAEFQDHCGIPESLDSRLKPVDARVPTFKCRFTGVVGRPGRTPAGSALEERLALQQKTAIRRGRVWGLIAKPSRSSWPQLINKWNHQTSRRRCSKVKLPMHDASPPFNEYLALCYCYIGPLNAIQKRVPLCSTSKRATHHV